MDSSQMEKRFAALEAELQGEKKKDKQKQTRFKQKQRRFAKVLPKKRRQERILAA